jgi:thymidylate synthase (FAD)
MSQIKVELQAHMGNDRSVSEAAWTSSLDYQKKQTRTDEDVSRVVKMLADLKHSTPFESVVMRFWIKMPIATDRQFMTHRLQSSSGMSGRYRTMPTEYLEMPQDVFDSAIKIPTLDRVDIKNKLGNSIGVIHNPGYNDLFDMYTQTCEAANLNYKYMVELAKDAERFGKITNEEFKRLREFARGMLPQHNMTERVTTLNLRSFANFIKLRNSEHAQAEIKQVAELMLAEVKKANVAPIAIEWLEKNGWSI